MSGVGVGGADASGAGMNGASSNSPDSDSPKSDGAGVDGPRTDGPRTDDPRANDPRTHSADKNGPRTHAGSSGKQFGTGTVRTRMILTVTPNPSLDRTYEVPSLDRGEVIRATGDRMDPGGKGVNVSRAVAAAGAATLAVLPLGGAPGALVAQLLDEQGIEVAPVPVAGQTRSNIAVAEPDGTLTKINATGPELTRAEAESLLSAVRERSTGADWIACCGSLPRGLAPSWYAYLVAR
ncbi:MAG: PfkB family carbohydrate kinase, partial [Streptomyces sp.]